MASKIEDLRKLEALHRHQPVLLYVLKIKKILWRMLTRAEIQCSKTCWSDHYDTRLGRIVTPNDSSIATPFIRFILACTSDMESRLYGYREQWPPEPERPIQYCCPSHLASAVSYDSFHEGILVV